MKYPAFLFTVMLSLAVFPVSVLAQVSGQGLYYHLTYRTVAPENDNAYRAVLSEIIRPMFEEEILNGRLSGWFVYRTYYKGEQEPYNYVFFRASTELGNLQEPFEGGFEAAVQRVHGDRLDEINSRLAGISVVVKDELWMQNPISVLQANAQPQRWANVGFYRNHTQRDVTRDLLLQNVVAQFQLGRIDRGVSSGWAYFSRRFPFDDQNSYNVTDMLFYEKFDQILGAGIGEQIWSDVRSDTTNLSDNMDRLRESRTEVKRELWELVEFAR